MRLLSAVSLIDAVAASLVADTSVPQQETISCEHLDCKKVLPCGTRDAYVSPHKNQKPGAHRA
jgi:hypothetical protein